MNHPCEPRNSLLHLGFTGADPARHLALRKHFQTKPQFQLNSRIFHFAVCFLLHQATAYVGIAAPPTAQYRFEAGETLSYKMELTVSNRTLNEARLFGNNDKSEQCTQVQLSLEYQLMPILQTDNGDWKIRIVFDRAEQLLNRDGEVKKTALNRDALKGPRIDPYEIMKLGLKNSWSRPVPLEGDTNAAAARPLAMQLHVEEELIDDPVLAWISANGRISKFQDRPEIQLVMPGVNFKECLELVIPTVPAATAQDSVTWTRQVPVDLPATPLKGANVPPMTFKLSYTLKKAADFEGKKCAGIALHGRFLQDGLSIPIGQEEMNYLNWTTFLSRIEDEVDGEYVFDLEQGIILSSEVRSTYRYQTFSGRKADNYRGRITANNTVQSFLVNRLVPASPQASHDGEPRPRADSSKPPPSQSNEASRVKPSLDPTAGYSSRANKN